MHRPYLLFSRGASMFRFAAILVCSVGLACGPFSPQSADAGTFEAASRQELRLIQQKVRAAQFLSRTTFGPTIAEIEELAQRMLQIGTRRACVEWIDNQMSLPASLHVSTIDAMLADHQIANDSEDFYVDPYRYHAFYHNALRAPDQLRQRVAWALSQIFVISDLSFNVGGLDKNLDGVPQWYAYSSYYDHLVREAFGDYRTLLRNVTLHPAMGEYLSHLRNAKADPANNYFPDENYAREVMQLFSIGLYELELDGRLKQNLAGELIPTYDMETVKSFARVFTGLTLQDSEYFYWSEQRDYNNPMEMWDEYHDNDAKELLNGTILPASLSVQSGGMADVNAAIDNIADHPNVGPFIARHLIQRLVRSNPSRGYVRRVVTAFNDGNGGQGGDLGAMVKAILIDPEVFRSIREVQVRRPDGTFALQVRERGTEYSRFQEPMLHHLAMVRGLEAEATYQGQPSSFVVMPRMQWDIGQSPFSSPSVFNFYTTDYQPPGPLADSVPSRRISTNRLAAPEFKLLTPVRNNQIANLMKWIVFSGKHDFTLWGPVEPHRTAGIEFDYTTYLAMIDTEREALLDRLDLVFCRGTLEDQTKANILAAIADVSAEQSWTEPMDRLTAMIYCVIESPDCWVTQ